MTIYQSFPPDEGKSLYPSLQLELKTSNLFSSDRHHLNNF